MANEIQNEFFGAIRAIVDANPITTFDKTIIGKIIKVYDDQPGVYRIQSDNITFDAKSQYSNYEYAEEDNVYITIRQGNYNGDKVIVGKVESKDLEKSTYTSPFAQIITTGFEKSNQLLPKELTINSEATQNECSISYNTSPHSLQMLDYLGVEVQFESKIEKTVGSYGLTFICKGQGPLLDENGDQEKDEEGQPIIGDVELPIAMSCLQLYGNPYYSNGTLTKKAIISLADLAGRIIGPVTISKVILESKDIEWTTGDYVTCKSLVLQPAQDFTRYPKESLEIVINENNSNEIILNKWVHIVDDEPVFITSNDLSLVTQADTISYYIKPSNSGKFELIATKSLNDKSGWSCIVENPPSLGEYKAVLNISPFTESNPLSFGEVETPEVKVGPPNTLRIEPIGDIRVYCEEAEKPSYKAIYYNADGQSEELTEVEWTWAAGGTDNGDTYAITSYPSNAGDAILSAAARNLTVSIPIGKTKIEDYKNYIIEGTTHVTYSSEGTNPEFESIPYTINGENISAQQIDLYISESSTFYGKFVITEDSKLQVPTRINSTNPSGYLVLMGDIIYPIIIERKAFENERINRWSGDLTIDSEGNYILSNLIGAGIKEDKENDKTLYTGVLMGLLEDSTTPENFSRTGIYGFKKSQRVFQLDDSGYFYVGNINGHLSFDEDGLLLQTQRLIVDVKDNKDNTIFKIDSTATGDGIVLQAGSNFSVTGNGKMTCKDGQIGDWVIGTQSLYYYTGGTYEAFLSPRGWGNSNKITIAGFTPSSSQSTYWGIKMGDGFGVSTGGKLHATGASISGTLNAGANSQIGPWKIENEQFTNTTSTSNMKYNDAIIYVWQQKTNNEVYKVKLTTKFSIGTEGVSFSGSPTYTIVEKIGHYPQSKYSPQYSEENFQNHFGMEWPYANENEEFPQSFTGPDIENTFTWLQVYDLVSKSMST